MIENETQAQSVKDLAAPLSKCKMWIRVLALMSVLSAVILSAVIIVSVGMAILYGPRFRFLPGDLAAIAVMAVLAIAGLVLAQLFVFMGVQLYKSVAANEAARTTGQKEKLLESLDHLGTYFTLMGVLAVLGVFLKVVAIVILRLR